MSANSITKFYDLLTSKMGREAAENITTFIENQIKDEVENKSSTFATRADLANAKADIIKWMFIFWIGQVVATFGFILLYLEK